MKKIVVLLVVLLGCMPVTAFAQKQFFFKDGKFVVAQFTDLHWMPGSAKCSSFIYFLYCLSLLRQLT